MNKDTQNKKLMKPAQRLSLQRKEILSLPADKALDYILNAPNPYALVPSFPEEDLYFLVHDIGLEDSLSLLSLASGKQWEYMVDIEVWKKDRIEIRSVTKWLDLLFRADPDRFIKWFLDKKLEFIEFYLFKNIEVIIRKHDQDPSDFGKGFFTLDNTFYVRFRDYPFEVESDGQFQKIRNKFLTNFIHRVAAYNLITYQNVLLESSSVIPSELEEEDYRLRNVRLAEKGFLPFDEAIGIYQPLKAQDIDKQGKKYSLVGPDLGLHLPVPVYTAGMLQEHNLFTDALQTIKTEDVLLQIQSEFAGLANQIIAADQKNIRNRDELRNVVKKACGYISIGIERLTGADKTLDANQSAALIQKYMLSHVFRVGYTLCLELKWKAEKWRSKSWFAKNGLALSFWDEEWLGVLGGLLIKKPLFYDNYKTTSSLYREFSSVEDIREAEKVLNEVIAFDNLLSLMTIKFKTTGERTITYKNLILTLWARHYMGLSEELAPLLLDELKTFFDDLLITPQKSKQYNQRKTGISIKESFLNWLSEKTGLNIYEITQRLGQTLENLFNDIESEYGAVAKKDLDPRYIHLFLVKQG
ncbi:MAG: DUF6178 family protein [Thermodesulfobacteriota bacterium]|nr:DUF6178 family protein [Thermodesulfobacteriota bacterium]